MKLPFLPALGLNRILGILFLVAVAVLLFRAREKKQQAYLDEQIIEVQPLEDGEKLITEANVSQLIRKRLGTDVSQIDLGSLEISRIEAILEQDPFINQADVYVDHRNNLHIKVTQRVPVLRVMDEAGENYYLDQEGNRIPASRNYTARVMVATGPINSYSLDFKSLEHHNLKEALLLACRIMEDDFLEGIVQQLHVLPGGEWMLVPLLGRQKVILGSVDDLKNKFERLKIFYQEAMPYTGWNTYSTLNVKYNGQVVCK